MVLAPVIFASVVFAWNSVLDFLYYRLPNKLFYTLFYLFPLHALITKNPSILSHYGAFLVFLVLGMGGFAFSLFDAGDAKLLAVTSLWLGWSKILPFLIIMALVGGIIGLMYMYVGPWIYQMTQKIRSYVLKHRYLYSFIKFFIEDLNSIELQVVEMQEKRLVPYGIAISIAALLSLWGSV